MTARVIAWMLLGISATVPVSASVLFGHVGDANPTSEGFLPSNAGTGLANDLGFAAWQYSGNGSPTDYHSGALTPQEKAEAFSQGWELDLRARLPQNDTLLFGNVDFGTVRFDINLLLSPSGNLTAVLNNFGAGPAYSYAVPGPGSDWHLYQMIYDPVSATARLDVDGSTVLTGYTGHTQFVSDLGLWFGTTGAPGNFNLVEFSTNVPEASSILLLGGGLMALGLARRLWR